MQNLRRLIQVLFLAVFTVLMVLGRAQFWMAFIFASILLSSIIVGFIAVGLALSIP